MDEYSHHLSSSLDGGFSNEPLIVEAKVEGYLVRRIYVYGGVSVEVMFSPTIKARLWETRTDLVGFTGEATKPLGKIKLEDRHESIAGHTFHNPFNDEIPHSKGNTTLVTRSVIISECMRLEKKQVVEEGEKKEDIETRAINITEEIRRNLEAYVDDIVIKSNDEKMLLADVAETFDNLRKINMKLNSKKNALLESKKETLYAYLAVSKEVVSSVLLTDRKWKQCPIYYVSRTLNEAERNYALMEKLALSLLHMTRRLRRYFDAHPIKVITDQPIKQILNKTEASRKLAQYVVKLGAYNITFEPRNAVKGQALRLTFDSTNNEAEYEALLAGLRIAKKMNIQRVEKKVDSKLVASQINGSYIANNDSMVKYLAKAREYIACFKSLSIKNILRNQNQKADVLSKLASVGFNYLTKEVLVKVLNERSTEVKEISIVVEEERDN
ncbi:reverse transcriptase domain-containing protein [Tanacetum coccineum]